MATQLDEERDLVDVPIAEQLTCWNISQRRLLAR